MEDSEFDKLYADKMRQAGAPDFSDEDWERLQPRLDAADRKRWRTIPLWWLGALSGLLLLSNLFWWWMWHQGNSNTSDQGHIEKHTTTSIRDTVWDNKVIVRYDTVYRTIRYQLSESLSQSQTTTSKAPDNSTAGISAVDPTADKRSQADTNTSENSSESASPTPLGNDPNANTDVKGQETTVQNAWEQALDQLPVIPDPIPAPTYEPDFLTFDVPPVVKKPARKPLVLKPRQVRVGPELGLLIPKSPYLSSGAGFFTGLSGELAFSENLAMTFSGTYGFIGFKGREYHESLGLPPFKPKGVDTFSIRYYETEEHLKPTLQFALGFRYWIAAQRKLSPYIGLGYAMQWQLPYELKVEYIDEVQGNKRESSVHVPFDRSPLPMLDLGIGIRYKIGQHWRLQTGLGLQYELDPERRGIPYYWSWRNGVLYAF